MQNVIHDAGMHGERINKKQSEIISLDAVETYWQYVLGILKGKIPNGARAMDLTQFGERGEKRLQEGTKAVPVPILDPGKFFPCSLRSRDGFVDSIYAEFYACRIKQVCYMAVDTMGGIIQFVCHRDGEVKVFQCFFMLLNLLTCAPHIFVDD